MKGEKPHSNKCKKKASTWYNTHSWFLKIFKTGIRRPLSLFTVNRIDYTQNPKIIHRIESLKAIKRV